MTLLGAPLWRASARYRCRGPGGTLYFSGRIGSIARQAAPQRAALPRLRGEPRHNLPNLTELLASWQDLRQTFDPVLASRAGAGAHDARLPGLDAESVKLQLAALKSLAGAVELADLADDGEEI